MTLSENVDCDHGHGEHRDVFQVLQHERYLNDTQSNMHRARIKQLEEHWAEANGKYIAAANERDNLLARNGVLRAEIGRLEDRLEALCELAECYCDEDESGVYVTCARCREKNR